MTDQSTEVIAMPIRIDRRHLRAVSLFAPENDIRYYLNGVLVHVLDDGAVRLVGTNGHAIAITHTPMDDLFQREPRKIIIPIDVVKLIAARKSDDNNADVSTLDGKSYKIQCVGLSINFDPIEGNFPDYERVVPSVISGETAQYNPELLMRFAKAAAIYGSKDNHAIHVEYNGDGGALVHVTSTEFIGVVMPWRQDNATGLPAWIKPGRAAPESDDGGDAQTRLPGIKTADEIKAEATDKPLATIGDGERAPA